MLGKDEPNATDEIFALDLQKPNRHGDLLGRQLFFILCQRRDHQWLIEDRILLSFCDVQLVDEVHQLALMFGVRDVKLLLEVRILFVLPDDDGVLFSDRLDE